MTPGMLCSAVCLAIVLGFSECGLSGCTTAQCYSLLHSAVCALQDSFDRLCLPASALPCLQSATVNSDQAPYLAIQSSRLSTKGPSSSSALTTDQSGDGQHITACQPDQEPTEKGVLNWLQVWGLYSTIA